MNAETDLETLRYAYRAGTDAARAMLKVGETFLGSLNVADLYYERATEEHVACSAAALMEIQRYDIWTDDAGTITKLDPRA